MKTGLSYNFLYWLVFPVMIGFCYYLYNSVSGPQKVFYGYAENKETQIRLDEAVKIKSIAVSPGQKVSKGSILLEVEYNQADIDMAITRHTIEQLKKKARVNRNEMRAALEKAVTDKTTRTAALESEIAAVKSKLDYQISMLKNSDEKEWNNPLKQSLTALNKELNAARASYDKVIDSYKKILDTPSPEEEEANGLQEKLQLLNEAKKKSVMLAPFDGLVGNIACRPSEYVEEHSTLISFYEITPAEAIAYVHESMSLTLRSGDSVWVSSVLHPQHRAKGVITGLGHRIIEIPERLRKIPEYKTYGMEVYISLDKQNAFLQKEALKFSLIHE